MTTFLTIIGGVLIGIVACIAVIWWWLKRKIKGIAELIMSVANSGIPPFRLTLEKTDEAEWKNPKSLNDQTSTLEDAGYICVGDFNLSEQLNTALRGFCNTSESTYATLYEHPETGNPILDIVALLADGQILTVSNVSEAGLDRPSFSPIIRLDANLNDEPGAAQKFHECMVSERAGRPVLATLPAEFSNTFTDVYARQMDWQIARGGPTENEIRRGAAITEVEEPDDEAVQGVRQSWQSAISDFIGEQVHEFYVANNSMPASEWEQIRDRVFFVYNQKPASELIELLADWVIEQKTSDDSESWDDSEDEDPAYTEAKQKFQSVFDKASNVREAFVAVQVLLPENGRYQKIDSVKGHYPSDVYLSPEDADDD